MLNECKTLLLQSKEQKGYCSFFFSLSLFATAEAELKLKMNGFSP